MLLKPTANSLFISRSTGVFKTFVKSVDELSGKISQSEFECMRNVTPYVFSRPLVVDDIFLFDKTLISL